MSAPRRSAEKIVTLEQARAAAEAWRAAAERVTVACGSGDLLGWETVRRLEAARGAGRLVVGVRGDAAARERLGGGRPLLPAADRALLIAALETVDRVVALDTAAAEAALVALAAGTAVVELDPPAPDAAADPVARVRARLERAGA